MGAKTLENLPGWAMELLTQSRVAHLGLRDGAGAPRVLPVTFALHAESVWTVVDNKPKRVAEPARVRWLHDRPEAAFTVDRYDDDWTRLAWVQVLGAVEVLGVDAAPGALAALAAKYPQYRTDAPPGPLLRLAPARVLCWSASAG
jgi:PPOX class probable F420-dependent enzyme